MADVGNKLDYQFVRMFDCYKGLLTDRQRHVMELYYNEDYSFSEIAEMLGITRQAVNDSLRHSRQLLLETEAKLGVAERMQRLRVQVTAIRDAAGERTDIAALSERALEIIED